VTPDRDRERLLAELDVLREEIGRTDAGLVELIARRARLARRIGSVKQALDLPVLDPRREAEVVRRVAALARECGVDPELARDVLWRIIDHARTVQRADGPPESS
jgi:chorismate mutase/prephenate dehydrogenase